MQKENENIFEGLKISFQKNPNSVSTTNFFVIDFPESRNLEIANQQKKKEPEKYDLLVALDCSGSMSGTRIRLATEILSEITKSPSVHQMEIFKFGSTVQEPCTFKKGSADKIKNINADCGGTNFQYPMEKMISMLQNNKSSRKLAAIFFSDGEASDPTYLYAPLRNELDKNDCPLLSVAVTTNAQPELMIKLSKLYGETELVLLRQNDTAENGFNLIMDKMSFGHSLLNVTAHLRTKEKAYQTEFKFREGQEKLFLSLTTDTSFMNDAVDLKLDFEGFKEAILVKIRNLDDLTNVDQRNEKMSSMLQFLTKDYISKMVNKTTEKEEGLRMIRELRQLIISCSVSDNYFQEIEKLRKDKSNSARLVQIIKKQKDLKTNTIFMQSKLNQLEQIIGGGDLRMALEAYSAKAVTNKFNKRAMHLMQKNKDKNMDSVIKGSIIESLLNSCPDQTSQSTPECILWCINQIESGLTDWQADKNVDVDFSSLDWVGRACLVNPGKTAALSAWQLESVLVRPLNISNGSVSYVKVSEVENGRRLAKVKGIHLGEFNCSIPFVHPDENLFISRLSLGMMKRTNSGTRAFSDLFCGTPDLFAIGQVFSLYTVTAVSCFEKAETSIEFEDCIRSLMTLWDLNFLNLKSKDPEHFSVLKGGSPADEFIKENISRLVADPAEFIARKDDLNLPDSMRMLYLLLVGDDHLKSMLEGKFFEFMNDMMYKMFYRKILDSTSSRFDLLEFTGFKHEEYSKLVLEKVEKVESLDTLQGEFKFKVDTKLIKLKRFVTASVLLEALHKFSKDNDCKNFRELHFKLLSKQIAMDSLVNHLKTCQKVLSTNPIKLAFNLIKFDKSKLLGLSPTHNPRIKLEDEPSINSLLNRMVISAIRGHPSKSSIQPKHDSTYNKNVMTEFPDFQSLYSENFNKILLGLMKNRESAATSEFGVSMKLMIRNKTLIKKIENYNRICCLEKLIFPLRTDKLSFSGDEVPTFVSRIKMFNYLRLSAYGKEILEELKTFHLGNITSLDIPKILLEKSRYLHGRSLYCESALKNSNSLKEFQKRMEKDMENHYKNKNLESTTTHYNFNIHKIKHLKNVCFHVYNDYKIYQFLKKCPNNGTVEDLYKVVLEKFPGCLTWNNYIKERREEHLRFLVGAKINKEFPFSMSE